MSSNKRSKTAALQAILTIESTVDSIDDLQECERLERKLKDVLKKTQAKVASLEVTDSEKGLHFKGIDSVACKCGNTVDPEGRYATFCEYCDEDKLLCTNCVSDCGVCKASICEECEETCKCCEQRLCEGCRTSCEHCTEYVCEECTTSAGYRWHTMTICTDCADDWLHKR